MTPPSPVSAGARPGHGPAEPVFRMLGSHELGVLPSVCKLQDGLVSETGARGEMRSAGVVSNFRDIKDIRPDTIGAASGKAF